MFSKCVHPSPIFHKYIIVCLPIFILYSRLSNYFKKSLDFQSIVVVVVFVGCCCYCCYYHLDALGCSGFDEKVVELSVLARYELMH